MDEVNDLKEVALERFEKNIPQELKDLRQWVLWKSVPRDDSKTDKLPFTIKGYGASSANPEDFSTYQEVIDGFRSSNGRYAGIGFQFLNSGYTGIDIDDCFQDEWGFSDPAKLWIKKFNSYTELSQSGKGIHIIVKGSKKGITNCRIGKYEIYDTNRFFAITGDIVEEFHTTNNIENRQSEINSFIKAIFKDKIKDKVIDIPNGQDILTASISDEDIIKKINNNKLFNELFNEGYKEESRYDSHSEADHSFCCFLCECTREISQVDRIFRLSKLYREKWDEIRGDNTYGAMTIANALKNTTVKTESDLSNPDSFESAYDYAVGYHNLYKKAPELFEYKGCYYYSDIKEEKNKDDKIICYCVSDFVLKNKYFVEENNDDVLKYKYVCEIIPNDAIRKKSKIVLKAGDFKKLDEVFEDVKCNWVGGKDANLALRKKIFRDEQTPDLRQLNFIGYDEKTNCYINRYFSINSDGEIIKPNKDKFFELSDNDFIKPFMGNDKCIMIDDEDVQMNIKNLCDLLYDLWGEKGLIAFSWMVASWFVREIKDNPTIGFFPFITLYGDSQSGKSSLSEILSRVQGINDEGITMSKINTKKGEIRKISQFNSLSVALIEGQERGTKFDYKMVLPLFNNNILQHRAKFSNDSETTDLEFLGTLMFIQNSDVFKTKQEKERVIHLKFIADEDKFKSTIHKYYEIKNIPVSQFPNVFVEVMKHKDDILNLWFKKYEKAKNYLREFVMDNRISEVHAVVLAMYQVLKRLFDVKHSILDYVVKISQLKKKECATRISTSADQLIEIIKSNYLGLETICLTDEEKCEIQFRLQAILDKIYEDKISFPAYKIGDLEDSLKNHPDFIDHKKRYFPESLYSEAKKQRQSWIFKLDTETRKSADNSQLSDSSLYQDVFKKILLLSYVVDHAANQEQDDDWYGELTADKSDTCTNYPLILADMNI